MLEDCHLYDVGFVGRWFTWERGNLPETNIQERLDRRVANTEWIMLFPNVKVQHFTHTFSDHYPLLLDTRKSEDLGWISNFRFEAWWFMEESFINEVKLLWENSSRELLQRLANLKEGLKKWARRIQFNKKRSKRVLTEKLEELVIAERDDKTLAELIDTMISLNFEIEKDECYWEQRVRTNWLKFGDKNTKFFHSHASHRKKRNFIHKLKNEKGGEMVFVQGLFSKSIFSR